MTKPWLLNGPLRETAATRRAKSSLGPRSPAPPSSRYVHPLAGFLDAPSLSLQWPSSSLAGQLILCQLSPQATIFTRIPIYCVLVCQSSHRTLYHTESPVSVSFAVETFCQYLSAQSFVVRHRLPQSLANPCQVTHCLVRTPHPSIRTTTFKKARRHWH